MSPKFQHFNDLEASRYEELKRDIAERGVLIPVITDEDGQVIDGHQRRRVCAELHIDCPAVVVPDLSEDEKHQLAIVLNLYRRQLSGTERSKVIGEMARMRLSTRRIGAILGVSKSTVANAITELSNAGQLERPETVEGPDGKVYPTAPRRPVPADVDPDTGEILGSEDRQGQEVPDDESAPFQAREPQPTSAAAAPWTAEEESLRDRLENGETVVVNIKTHGRLIAWACERDLYVRVDRQSQWGNPFLLPADGSRDQVCNAYADHYLPHKPSLAAALPDLKGKALGCWCAPERCHADTLRRLAG